MNVIAVSGYKDTGKSTLCRALLAGLRERGFKVGYMKRTQEPAASSGDTDTGAALSLGVDALLWGEDAMRFESARLSPKDASPADVAADFFPGCDVVILEGGKDFPLPKIWVLEPHGAVPDYPGIFAVYDRHGEGNGAERYGAGEADRLISDLSAKLTSAVRSTRVYVGCRELPMKDFVADFIGGGIRGMLSSLKGFASGDIRVYIRHRGNDR